MYLTPKQVQKRFRYHPKTLAIWADEGKVQFTRSPGVHCRYLAASLEKLQVESGETVTYALVSTQSQT